jgi:hypothetical protein
MAYITVSLAVTLACWLLLAARGGKSSRLDAPRASEPLPQPSSAHEQRTLARPVDQLADHRRPRYLARHQQAA